MSLDIARLWRGLAAASGLLLAAWLSGCAATGPQASASDNTLPVQAAAQAASSAAPVQTAALPIVAPTAAPDTLQPDGQAYLFALDPLQPSVIIDPDDPSVRTDLWARVRSGFAMPDLDNELVLKWQQWYASRPDYVARMTERGGRYLFHVVEEIEKRGIPTELALLPFIESAFNPQAMSTARASGMWQFMPANGQGLRSEAEPVPRRPPRCVGLDARGARLPADAAAPVRRLAARAGSLQLGPGQCATRGGPRNLKEGNPPTYENLRMPDETRNYVPKLQAVKNIVAAPQAFAITLPALENHPYFLSVPITNDIDVDVAARLAGISLDEFQQLNPQMNKPVILAAGTPQVLLPYDNATLFVRNLRAHRAPLATWTAWVAPATLKPADVARQVGMSESELRAVNRIPPRMLVKAGSTLLVHAQPAQVGRRVGEDRRQRHMLLAPDRRRAARHLQGGKGGDSVAAVARAPRRQRRPGRAMERSGHRCACSGRARRSW